MSASRLAVLVFTDLVGSTALAAAVGATAYAGLLGRHNTLFSEACAAEGGEVLKHTGDGFLAAFATPSHAVRSALRFQASMRAERWPPPNPLLSRVGVHAGEVAVLEMAGRPDLVGLAADLAARVMALAQGGQVLMTGGVFNDARQFVVDVPRQDGPPLSPLRWVAHGPYLLKGFDEPVEVFEVGVDGAAPLSAPPGGERARRAVAHGQEQTLGWRPAVGLAVDGRPGWVLERKLGQGGFGEVWLAQHERTRQRRVFKFCFDAERLRSFKRELTLFRLLREALGEREDIATLHEVRLDRPPFYLESDYAAGGNLGDWAAAQGGLASVPPERRLEIVAQVANAVAAAHSVGVLHKDIKPGNVLMHVDAGGQARPRLSDFGIGALADASRLRRHNITETGFTVAAAESSAAGTRMYLPPELLGGRPFTTQGDVYALGVLLYQVVIADVARPLAPGWERDVRDELLREDIAACVEGEPGRRPTAAGLAERLRSLSARRAERDAEVRRRAARARRARVVRRTLVTSGVLVLLCVAVGAASLLYARRIRAEQALTLHQKLVAERERAAARLESYVANLAAAESALRGGEALTARRRLAASPEEFRHFEWHALQAGCDQSLSALDAGQGPLHALAASPDGARLATAGEDGTVRVWDWSARREAFGLRGHGGPVLAVAFSRDGRRIGSGSADGTVRIWDAFDGRQVAVLRGHAGAVRGVSFSPDGRELASTGVDATVRVWRIAEGDARIVAGRPNAPWPPVCVAYNAAGNHVAIGRPGGCVLIDPADGRAHARHEDRHEDTYAAVFSPDGGTLAAAMSNGVCLLDAKRLEGPAHLVGPVRRVLCVTFSGDGSQVAGAGEDRALYLWDAGTRAPVAVQNGHDAAITGLAYVAGSARVVTASRDGTLREWDARPGHNTSLRGHESDVHSIAFSPDGTRLVSSGMDNTIRLWDVETATCAGVLRGHGDWVFDVSFSPDGRRVVSAGKEGRVGLWDAAAGAPPVMMEGHSYRVRSVAFSPDGRFVASAALDKTVRIWDAASGRTLRVLDGFGDPASADAMAYEVAFAPDGSRLAVGCYGGDIYVCDPADGRKLAVCRGHSGPICALQYSPDGRLLASASGDQTVRLWDALGGDGGGERAVLAGHTAAVRGVAFSPDGGRIASGSEDASVRLWDVQNLREVATFRGHGDTAVTAVAFSADGTRLASASADKTIRIDDAVPRRARIAAAAAGTRPAPSTSAD